MINTMTQAAISLADELPTMITKWRRRNTNWTGVEGTVTADADETQITITITIKPDLKERSPANE